MVDLAQPADGGVISACDSGERIAFFYVMTGRGVGSGIGDAVVDVLCAVGGEGVCAVFYGDMVGIAVYVLIGGSQGVHGDFYGGIHLAYAVCQGMCQQPLVGFVHIKHPCQMGMTGSV